MDYGKWYIKGGSVMQIVEYEVNKSVLLVGFKKDNFIVYSQIPYDETKSKDELLQLAYIQAKSSIDYESSLDEHSFVTDKEGYEFTPDDPIVCSVDLSVDNVQFQFEEGQEFENIQLYVSVKDQYGNDIASDVELITSLGEINGDILTIMKVNEHLEVTISAYVEDLVNTLTIHIQPYEEVVLNKIGELDNKVLNLEKLVEGRVLNLEESTGARVLDLEESVNDRMSYLEVSTNSRVLNLEQSVDIMLGGEILE